LMVNVLCIREEVCINYKRCLASIHKRRIQYTFSHDSRIWETIYDQHSMCYYSQILWEWLFIRKKKMNLAGKILLRYYNLTTYLPTIIWLMKQLTLSLVLWSTEYVVINFDNISINNFSLYINLWRTVLMNIAKSCYIKFFEYSSGQLVHKLHLCMCLFLK